MVYIDSPLPLCLEQNIHLLKTKHTSPHRYFTLNIYITTINCIVINPLSLLCIQNNVCFIYAMCSNSYFITSKPKHFKHVVTQYGLHLMGLPIRQGTEHMVRPITTTKNTNQFLPYE